jgi:hypothetical protein
LYFIYTLIIKIRVLRYHLSDFSGWAICEIDSIRESVTFAIVDEVKIRRSDISDERAQMFVPTDITEARRRWAEKIDRVQSSLRRNGMSCLGDSDRTFILSDKFQ